MEPLYQASCIYTFEMYKECCKAASRKLGKIVPRNVFICACLLILSYMSFTTGSSVLGWGMLLACVTVPFALSLARNRAVKKTWESASFFQNAEYRYSFYKDHMEVDNPNGHASLNYSGIFFPGGKRELLSDHDCEERGLLPEQRGLLAPAAAVLARPCEVAAPPTLLVLDFAILEGWNYRSGRKRRYRVTMVTRHSTVMTKNTT